LELGSRKVIVELPPEGASEVRVGPRSGAWALVDKVAGTFGPPKLVFECHQMSQLAKLVLEFGPRVNLAGVPLQDVVVLEMHRLGLTIETLGLGRAPQGFQGSPAAKFVFHLIRTEHPVDQSTLCLRSGLSRRTVQAALSSLVEAGMVRQIPDSSDMRRYRYTMG